MDPLLVLLGVVGAMCLAVVVWTGWKRFPLRIGIGNFFRRKAQVLIVIAGLLVGTAIISSSFVIQDTFDHTVRTAVYRATDLIDEQLFVVAPDGSRASFDVTIYDALAGEQENMAHVDGLAPRWHLGVAVLDNRTGLFEPSTTGIGFDAALDFGSFVRADGTAWSGGGLAADEVLVNERLARELDARDGDALTVFVRGVPVFPRIAEIVQDAGKGAWNDGPNLFMPLARMQAALGEPGRINTIVVSNAGGVEDGYLVTEQAVRELDAVIDPAWGLTIDRTKSDGIEEATEGVSQLSDLFFLLGTFTVITGVLLIMNIFVMLAEERKGEMGVARALGMRRSNLVQSFVAEGLLYGLLSAVVGAIAGLGVAAVILWAFNRIFPSDAFGSAGLVLHVTALSLIEGFALGFAITMATILAASVRVSKLNIVRAIRDIPEPIEHRSTRRQLAVGTGFAVAGALATIVGVAGVSPIPRTVGPAGLALGLAIASMRVLPPRLVFSAAGAFILFWVLNPLRLFEIPPDIGLFIVAGLELILGGLLIVMFNSETVLGFLARIVRRRTWRPVVRTAFAYPMNKKFRTGATLAMISLVMFTIATMAGIQAMTAASVDTATERQSGGFDLIAVTNPAIPKPDWEAEYAASAVSARIDDLQALSLVRTGLSKDASLSAPQNYSIVGASNAWANQAAFAFQALDPSYADAQQAWQALQTESDVVILDGNVVPQTFGPNFGQLRVVVGEHLYFRNATGSVRELRVIGILYQQFVAAAFVSQATIERDFRIDYPSLFYVRAGVGEDLTDVEHDLERTFVAYQLQALNIRELTRQTVEITLGIMNLLQAYLALGLIVGIAGLGVITMRNVVERRAETGALRALGFRRSMVLRSFLFELSFIALTGIGMGIVLGVLLTYNLFLEFFEGDAPFVVPWVQLAAFGAIAFGASVLATASPAIRASRMPPAEALRSYE